MVARGVVGLWVVVLVEVRSVFQAVVVEVDAMVVGLNLLVVVLVEVC